jgi:lipoate-protein ligase A
VIVNRLIIDPPAPGAWNMAVDEALLIDAATNGAAAMRFYRWSEPTVSLGYFQRYHDRDRHAASCDCAAVRRQTGGGAILHDREITYSIALPASHPLARDSESLYAQVHDAFIAVVSEQLTRIGGPRVSLRRNEVSNSSSSDEPFMCFERRAAGDVIAVPISLELAKRAGLPPSGGWKVLGSAQRRTRGALLQHGSLLLAASPAAPELPGLADITGWEFRVDDFDPLVERLEKALNLRAVLARIPSHLESKTYDLTNNKYAAAAWTKRR